MPVSRSPGHLVPLLLLLLLLLPVRVLGDGLVVGIVSERSAAELVAGAHRFLEQHPDAEVVLRTPEQIAEKPDADVAALWQAADAVLIAAVFGDQVGRLARLLQDRPPPDQAALLAINSDQTLTRLSRLGGQAVLAPLDADALGRLGANPDAGEDPAEHLAAQMREFADQSDWIVGRAHYQGRAPEHMRDLFAWLLAQAGHDLTVPEPSPRSTIRYYRHGEAVEDPAALALDDAPAVAILDLDSGDRPGDRALLDAACEAIEARELQCFAVLARWGGASLEAVQSLADTASPSALVGVLSLQDFTIGGGDGRRAVTEALVELDVPVIKGLRLAKVTRNQWLFSEAGLPWDSVHYRLAMPELQGVSQPLVLATAQPPAIDPQTGVSLSLTEPVADRVDAMAARMHRWARLRMLDNADKRVALVYYNHPPGRHNIGADNLDVPESLFEILQRLKRAGYDTGELPESAEALHDRIQEVGINLPEDDAALAAMADRIPSLSTETYQRYFDDLPGMIRGEMQAGPLGYLHERLKQILDAGEVATGQRVLERGIGDLRHLLENHEHAAQDRAIDLLDQYAMAWEALLDGEGDPERAAALRDGLTRTGIPGLTGWGEPPGRSMVREDRMLFPGIQFGNVFIGPQPPRGWEISERLLHANTSFPPTHQYVGFYHWLRDHFQADAMVYVGRHSTREFLPRRRAGLAEDDYPDLLGGDLPVLYPYIVDGVGEGIQAKRRAMGVMISHLTPPLAATELYDGLLELRQLVESYEAATDPDSPTRARAAETLRQRIKDLDLEVEIARELAQGHDHDHDHGDDHADRHHDDHDEEEHHGEPAEVDLDAVSEELLVHETGHYLTHMQERFMPLGLHVFGRDWSEEAVDTMLASMAGDDDESPDWRRDLTDSPGAERDALLAGLRGGFIAPGQGNDPIRTPRVLPTGRNFHALSSDLVPTRVAWALGRELAADARSRDQDTPDGSEALILWASDTVRDEGVMVAFGLDMLGVRPVWNARGIVEGLERVPLAESERQQRRDVLFTTSGLFRDLYEDQLQWLDLAARLALDGASETLRRDYPALETALDEALAPLPDDMRDPGDEPLARNAVARQWLEDTKQLLDGGAAAELAGRLAALRVFGTAPGAYGAGINRLTGRSGAWSDRQELADAYVRRMGHAYGADGGGEARHQAFRQRLGVVGRTYLGRSSHLYGLLDNDDGFDFQGGLSLAVEAGSGQVPDNRVLMHADPRNPMVDTLERALLSELRGRNLNPQWLQPLMEHGYAGARSMGSDFLENLWGWQVTNPDVVRSWVWDAVHDVYFADSHGIGLDEFLEQSHNVHVKTHMQAILLVAAQREFWQADDETLEALMNEFAEQVVDHGLPGSGHTRPDHPMLDWLSDQLTEPLRDSFEAVRAAARGPEAPTEDQAPTVIAELEQIQENLDDAELTEQPEAADGEPLTDGAAAARWLPFALLLTLALLFAAGIVAGRRR